MEENKETMVDGQEVSDELTEETVETQDAAEDTAEEGKTIEKTPTALLL